MNKNIVIFCESYSSLAYTLYCLTNENGYTTATIFIPVLEDLFHLMEDLNEYVFDNKLNIVYYKNYVPRWTQRNGMKRLLYIVPDIIAERRYLRQFFNSYFARVENADIMFPSPGYNGAKIYVLKRLSKKNRLVFVDPGGPLYMGKYFPRSIRDIAVLMIYKMV